MAALDEHLAQGRLDVEEYGDRSAAAANAGHGRRPGRAVHRPAGTASDAARGRRAARPDPGRRHPGRIAPGAALGATQRPAGEVGAAAGRGVTRSSPCCCSWSPAVVGVPADPAGRGAGVRRDRAPLDDPASDPWMHAFLDVPAELTGPADRFWAAAAGAPRSVRRGRSTPEFRSLRTGHRIALPAPAVPRRPTPGAPGPDHAATSTARPLDWSCSAPPRVPGCAGGSG